MLTVVSSLDLRICHQLSVSQVRLALRLNRSSMCVVLSRSTPRACLLPLRILAHLFSIELLVIIKSSQACVIPLAALSS